MSFYKEYWGNFLEAMKREVEFPLKVKKTAGDKNWIHWECFGCKGMKLIASLNQNDNWICVNFGIDSNNQKYHFTALKGEKDRIEKDFGGKLRWEPIGNERSNTQSILTKYNVDVQNRSQWPEQHAWMLDNLKKMFFAFKPQIDRLVID